MGTKRAADQVGNLSEAKAAEFRGGCRFQASGQIGRVLSFSAALQASAFFQILCSARFPEVQRFAIKSFAVEVVGEVRCCELDQPCHASACSEMMQNKRFKTCVLGMA